MVAGFFVFSNTLFSGVPAAGVTATASASELGAILLADAGA